VFTAELSIETQMNMGIFFRDLGMLEIGYLERIKKLVS